MSAAFRSLLPRLNSLTRPKLTPILRRSYGRKLPKTSTIRFSSPLPDHIPPASTPDRQDSLSSQDALADPSSNSTTPSEDPSSSTLESSFELPSMSHRTIGALLGTGRNERAVEYILERFPSSDCIKDPVTRDSVEKAILAFFRFDQLGDGLSLHNKLLATSYRSSRHYSLLITAAQALVPLDDLLGSDPFEYVRARAVAHERVIADAVSIMRENDIFVEKSLRRFLTALEDLPHADAKLCVEIGQAFITLKGKGFEPEERTAKVLMQLKARAVSEGVEDELEDFDENILKFLAKSGVSVDQLQEFSDGLKNDEPYRADLRELVVESPEDPLRPDSNASVTPSGIDPSAPATAASTSQQPKPARPPVSGRDAAPAPKAEIPSPVEKRRAAAEAAKKLQMTVSQMAPGIVQRPSKANRLLPRTLSKHANFSTADETVTLGNPAGELHPGLEVDTSNVQGEVDAQEALFEMQNDQNERDLAAAKAFLDELRYQDRFASSHVQYTLNQLAKRGIPVDRHFLNTLISLSVREKNFPRAFFIYQGMRDHPSSDIHPDAFAYASLFSAIERVSRPRSARTRALKILKNHPTPRQLFREMISCHMQVTNGTLMQRSGVVTRPVLNTALRAVLSLRDYPGGLTVLGAMPELWITADLETYQTVIRALLFHSRQELASLHKHVGRGEGRTARWVDRFWNTDRKLIADDIGPDMVRFLHRFMIAPRKKSSEVPTVSMILGEQAERQKTYSVQPLSKLLVHAISSAYAQPEEYQETIEAQIQRDISLAWKEMMTSDGEVEAPSAG